MSECKRPNVGPWTSHPKRMLRHKAMIQCARLAFGFGGIYDQDEAERIAEIEINPRQNAALVERAITQLPPYAQDAFDASINAWDSLIQQGKKSAEQIIAVISTKHTLSDAQKTAILDLEQPPITEGEVYENA